MKAGVGCCPQTSVNLLLATPHQAARTSKRGSAEAEAGLLALESLHRQVGHRLLYLATPHHPLILSPMGAQQASRCTEHSFTPYLLHSPPALLPPAQVMPFILRRTKDAVLADLPPKIVQASARANMCMSA